MSEQKRVRCRHQWRNIGPAGDYRGSPCVTWRCDLCGKEHDTYANCRPASGSFVEDAEAGEDS